MKKVVDLNGLNKEQRESVARALGVEVPEGATLGSYGSLVVTTPAVPVHVSEVIEFFRTLLEKHGDLPVAYADNYGRVYGWSVDAPGVAAVHLNMVAKTGPDTILWDKGRKPSPKSKSAAPKMEKIIVIRPLGDDNDDDDDFDDDDD